MAISLDIDIDTLEHLEFGIGRDVDDSQEFYAVRVNVDAQDVLKDMVRNTWNEMEMSVAGCPTQTEFEEIDEGSSNSRFVATLDEQTLKKRLAGGPETYSPADRYTGNEYVYLELDDPIVALLSNLHKSINLPNEQRLFEDLDTIFCYFVRMHDSGGRRITAIRRATGFKGVLKRPLLAQFTGDGLELSHGKVFKLDNDFDILVDSHHVHVWRPNSFESIGKLKEDILNAVPKNIEEIAKIIDYVDFGTITKYSTGHIMAARYVASIRAQMSQGPITRDSLLKHCKDTDVYLEEEGGQIIVPWESIMGFLEVLDRRRYGIELVEGKREQFRARNRQRIYR